MTRITITLIGLCMIVTLITSTNASCPPCLGLENPPEITRAGVKQIALELTYTNEADDLTNQFFSYAGKNDGEDFLSDPDVEKFIVSFNENPDERLRKIAKMLLTKKEYKKLNWTL